MDDKVKGIISYVFGWLGGLIVLLAFKDNNRKTTFHACQAITASVGFIVIRAVYGMIPIYIPFFSTVIWALNIVILVLGITKVVNNDNPEIPVVGDLTKSIFGKKINDTPDVVNNSANQNGTTQTNQSNQTSEQNTTNEQVAKETDEKSNDMN